MAEKHQKCFRPILTLPNSKSLLGSKKARTKLIANFSRALRMCDEINATAYGVVGNGSDCTAALQSAINAAASANQPLCLPSGTIGTTGNTGLSNLTIRGAGLGLTTLQLLTNTNNYLLQFTSCENISIEDLSFNGIASGATVGSDLLVIQTCYNYTIQRISVSNANFVKGYGNGIVIKSSLTNSTGTNKTQNGYGIIRDSQLLSNGQNGLRIVDDWNISVTGVSAISNSANGIFVDNSGSPYQADKSNNIQISGNRCLSNGGCGIHVSGFYIGSIGSPQENGYSPTPYQSQQIVISDNISNNNVNYGIAFQGANGTVSSNVVRQNGGSSVDVAGILFNAVASICTANTASNNSFFGIDVGGSYNCVVSDNTCQLNGVNGSTSNGGVGINAGATVCVTISGNSIVLNPNTSSQDPVGINAPGIDGDGITWFNWRGQNLIVSNNTIVMGNENSIGISISEGFQYANVFGNVVVGALTQNSAFELAVPLLVQNNNLDVSALPPNSVTYSVTSAATLIIPDVGEKFFVSGSTNITNLLTYSQSQFLGAVSDVIMSNNGTNYPPATTVAVTFTGGGGSGAAGKAAISSQGKVVGVILSARGSGYTSPPTVSFPSPGGGGTAATGVAVVGCANQDGRSVELFFQGAQIVTNGNALRLASSSITTNSNKTLLALRGAYGNWYQQYVSQLL